MPTLVETNKPNSSIQFREKIDSKYEILYEISFLKKFHPFNRTIKARVQRNQKTDTMFKKTINPHSMWRKIRPVSVEEQFEEVRKESLRYIQQKEKDIEKLNNIEDDIYNKIIKKERD